jgi:hypothetical protein
MPLLISLVLGSRDVRFRPKADTKPSQKRTTFPLSERLATGYCGEQSPTPIP